MLQRLRVGLLLLAVCAVGARALPAQPNPSPDSSEQAPIRLAVAGLVHGHVHGFLQTRPYADARLVGVAEADTALLRQRAEQYDVEADRRYRRLETMLKETSPDAVVVFTHTFGHRRVVETAAEYGVDVMVEKPLAVNGEHARAMQEAAAANDVDVLVNYETTWYPSTERVYDLARTQGRLGPLRKVVVRDGHRGPQEIGVGPAFLDWLTDPTLNGGGALMDFGCYGANLMTHLMDGARPTSVTAVTQQFKSDSVYAAVDDEATILLTYPGTQGLIQASWNWPYSRKDLSVYGQNGYVHADDATRMRVRVGDGSEQQFTLESEPPFYASAIPYLVSVVRGETEPSGLSSLANNVIVTEILDAARESARSGRTVRLQAE